MTNPIETIKKIFAYRDARKRIPQEVYQTLDAVHTKFSQLDTDINQDTLVETINNDPDIKRLCALSGQGGMGAIYDCKGGERTAFGGFGKTLCMDEKGLNFYEWDDYEAGIGRSVPANPMNLWIEGITAKDLKRAIVQYTDRDNYTARVADFKMFLDAFGKPFSVN